MANKKRSRNAYIKNLGRYRVNKRDILAVEKILRMYADELEMKHTNVSSIPEGRRHMPRRFADMNIKIGRYRPFSIRLRLMSCEIYYPGVEYLYSADSVKFLPKPIKKSRYVRVACDPSISVTFRPFSTKIYAKTHYATGKELKVMKSVIRDIESYLGNLKASSVNTVYLK